MATSSKRLEELLNNILQEFQYGYDVVGPATNNYKDSRVETALKNVSRLFGHSNMMLDENLLSASS